MKHRDSTIHALKNSKGKIFSVGDRFTTKGELKSKSKTIILVGKKEVVSKRKIRIYGFEAHENGWYILYMPQYYNGKIEKNPSKAWRMCDLESAVLIK